MQHGKAENHLPHVSLIIEHLHGLASVKAGSLEA